MKTRRVPVLALALFPLASACGVADETAATEPVVSLPAASSEPSLVPLPDDLSTRDPERREQTPLRRFHYNVTEQAQTIDPYLGALLTSDEVAQYFPEGAVSDWNPFRDSLLAAPLDRQFQEAHSELVPCSTGDLRPVSGLLRITGTDSTRVQVEQYLTIFETAGEATRYANLLQESFNDPSCWALSSWDDLLDPGYQLQFDEWTNSRVDERDVWRTSIEIPVLEENHPARFWQETIASFPAGGTLEGSTVFLSREVWLHRDGDAVLLTMVNETLERRISPIALDQMISDTALLLQGVA